MDDLKTRIRTTQCEFEIQLEHTARLAQLLRQLMAKQEAEEAAKRLSEFAGGECAVIWSDKD